MAEVTNELLLEVLKQMQAELSDLKGNYLEVRQELIAIRDHTNAVQRDVANLYSGQAKVETHIDEIRKRLSLLIEPAE